MKRIAVTTTSFGEYDDKPLKLLKEQGFAVSLNPRKRKMIKEEVIEFCKEAVGIIAGTERLDGDVLDRLANLKVISRCGSGIDNVDLNAAERKGIAVFNTPDAATSAVGELTVALIIGLLRRVNDADAAVKNGRWVKIMGDMIYGKRVGIIGFGRIGRRVAELLRPFGCIMAYSDPSVKDGLAGFEQMPLSRLIEWADIISIHVSGNSRILGRDEVAHMKRGAWLVNTSRGGVVDEDALYAALKEKRLSGAGLDVFEQEPYTGPLRELGNCILTPHIGSYAKEARILMETEAVRNLLRGLQGLKEEVKE